MHGKKHTEETKQKMRDSSRHISLKGEDSPNYGLKRSIETRNKISLARTGISNGTRSDEIKQKMKDKRKLQTKTSQKEVMVFGAQYMSLKEACDTLNRNHKYIIYRLRSEKYSDCYYL